MHPLRPAREPEATSGPAAAAAFNYTFGFRYQTWVQEVLVPVRLLEGREVTNETVRAVVENHPSLLRELMGCSFQDYRLMRARPDLYRLELERTKESITVTPAAIEPPTVPPPRKMEQFLSWKPATAA